MKDTERVPQPADEPLFIDEDGAPRFETVSAEDLFEEVALPEDESSAALQFETWREIPADDPSRIIPEKVGSWSDARNRFFQLRPKLMMLAALAVAFVAVGGLGYIGLLSLSRREPALVDASRPAASLSQVPRAPVVASTPASAAPAVPSVPTERVAVVSTPQTAPPPAREPSPSPASTSSSVPPVRPLPTEARAPVAPDRGVVRTERAATPSLPPVRPTPPPSVRPTPTPPLAPRAAVDAPPATIPSAPVAAPATPAFVPYVPVQPEPVPAPAATVPPAAASAPAPAVVPDDDRLRALMDRYRAAFGSLDANQVRQVWPSVDTRGLSRAFGQLSSQRFEFSGCAISVNGDRGVAACSGTAEYVTKVGSKSPKWDPRDWTFEFRRVNQDWRIESVVTR